jgi:hypothetical protein
MLLVGGCAPTGYITASVQSVIGLDISENPQTQVPHIRFGFVRNQLFYIPTGKTKSSGSMPGSAAETPELLSDIDVYIEFLSQTRIKERFAVGPEAVKSGAAAILFVPPGTPVPTVVFEPVELSPLAREIRQIIRDPGQRDKAKVWIQNNFPNHPNRDNPDAFVDTPPKPEVATLRRLLQDLKHE